MGRKNGFIPRLNAWLLHSGSDRYNKQVHERKKRLFSGLRGQILEIGPGTGANLEYYPADVSLIGLEPNPYMQRYLKEKARTLGISMEVVTGTAEEIPLPDESVDAVVSTLVLCSVQDLFRSLAEIKRVLKQKGQFVFMEHVAAGKNTRLRNVQRWIKPVWKYMADGCHPDRETWKAVDNAGFDHVHIDHFRLPLPVVGPHIMGTAVK
jgi:ubiquinone/menaquinone biosynthesis C-methylase UbiE